MDIVLIAGLWLDGSVWDPVASSLGARGLRAVPVTLPGQGLPPSRATLEDQRAAVVAAVGASAPPVLVVGHSAASTLAWMAADAEPEAVARVAMIGGFPLADGATYNDGFPIVDGWMPFPGWEPFEGPDADDLAPAQRQAIASAAVPVPEGVARGIVRLRDARRYDVPVTIVCPEFSPDQAREWVGDGSIPELARASTVEYVNLASGHWPMVSCPDVLADLLAGLADG